MGFCAVVGLEEVESGGCAFEGVELEGLEFCDHAAAPHDSTKIKNKLRIRLF